jgi:hypothetical protein
MILKMPTRQRVRNKTSLKPRPILKCFIIFLNIPDRWNGICPGNYGKINGAGSIVKILKMLSQKIPR